MHLLAPEHLLATFGVVGLFLIVFAETGLLVGFFLPGDSLLFTAGLLTSTSAGAATHLPLAGVIGAAAAGALLGAQVGYLLGRRYGSGLLDRPDRPKLQAAVERSRHSLARYGVGKAVVLARFIPFVRTVVNPLAGTVGVSARTFTVWQVVGGLVWTVGLVTAGRVAGATIPDIDRYLLPAVVAVVMLSLVPVLLEVRHARVTAPRAAGTDPTARA